MPAFGLTHSGSLLAARSATTVGSTCSMPAPQLHPTTSAPASASAAAQSPACAPIMVCVRWGPESNDMLAITGSPVASFTAFKASRISASSENVSSTITSAPPAASASACSANTDVSSSAAASRTARILPLGPIEPATSAFPRPTAWRASAAPLRFNSSTSCFTRRRSRFSRFAANVLVVMKRAPAAT